MELSNHTNDCLTASGTKQPYKCNSSNISEQTFTVRIANMSTPSECSTTGFSQTACGFVVEFADIIDKHNFNSAGLRGTTDSNEYQWGSNYGGYSASEMREYLNTILYNALPSDLKNVIIDTYTVSGYGSAESNNFTSTEKLYLLSQKEVYNNTSSDTAASLSRQLDYYSNKSVTKNSYTDAIKKYNGSALHWWLRTAQSNNNHCFLGVVVDGALCGYAAWNNNGVSPSFRIG